MVFVDSSSIEAIGYDAETAELHVRFLQGGETYVYSGVEPETFDEFMRVDSKGRYYNANIRPRYGFYKL